MKLCFRYLEGRRERFRIRLCVWRLGFSLVENLILFLKLLSSLIYFVEGNVKVSKFGLFFVFVLGLGFEFFLVVSGVGKSLNCVICNLGVNFSFIRYKLCDFKKMIYLFEFIYLIKFFI